MKKLGLFFTFILYIHSLIALTVIPSPSTLNCGTTAVTFTFDCSFTGSVLLPFVPQGIMHNETLVKVVTNGVTTFDLIVDPSVGSNFVLNFIVISSDSSGSCAPINASASASFTTSCIMPQNNDCANAIPISISTNSCTTTAFSTTNASYSGNTPSCGIPDYYDLFYTFNANNDTITMEIPTIPGNVGFYGLYDGCPLNSNQVACRIMIASNGSTYSFTNLNVGSDYYLQILFIPGTAGTDQEICLYSSTTQAAVDCPTTIDVSDIGPNFPNQSYTTHQTITTSGSSVLSNNGIVFNTGMEIILNPGFCTSTFDFEAIIDGCSP